MKKNLNNTLALIMSAAIAAGCSVEDPLKPDDSKINTGDKEPAEETVTFTATLESANKTAWTAGEEILVFDGSLKTVKVSAAGASSPINGELSQDADEYIGYWPASDKPEINAGGIRTSVPTVQAAAESVDGLIKLVARSNSGRIAFDDVFSYVAFSTSMENVSKFVFTSDKDIAGGINITFENGAPKIELTEPSKTVEVTGAFEPGKTYYFLAVPEFNGEITSIASAGSKEYEMEGLATDFMAGQTAELPLIYKPCPLKGVYQISHLWVYGGTGPEYGGGGVRDLYENAGYFVSKTGRGIEAEKDNFIEVLQDGTMYNWAGVDEKHSRFVFKSEFNKKQPGYPIELEKFYRKLPKGQSTVVADENGNVTFIDADGNEFSGTVVPAGEYENAGGSKTVISTMALRFTIEGGKDDWSNNFTEYDKLAAHPRTLWIEVTPMAKGFTVPQESKTTEVIPEDEVLDPDEPLHTSFDFTQLPGAWGFDSAEKDLLVLGGCGSDPAFIGPVAKSWCWNDSIWKIGDDRVNISVDNGKFFFNYWAGNDGKFWDCVYNNGEDLSGYYGRLPKGKHEVDINMETLVVTFSNGYTAQFYEPGTYQFSEFKKEAVIPDGCWALYFDFGAPAGGYPENSNHWNDIDRFVTSPHGYLMIFHKK